MHPCMHSGEFELTDDRGRKFTHDNVKKEFAVLLFGALDHEDVHLWLEKFAHALYESGMHTVPCLLHDFDKHFVQQSVDLQIEVCMHRHFM